MNIQGFKFNGLNDRKTRIVIPGRPITKKNSMIIVNAITKTGKKYKRPISSKTYRQYEKDCLKCLMAYRGPKFQGPVHIKALYYMPHRGAWPDLLGLEQATADILEKARIIYNDRDIVNWDGSRIAGVDSHNPRVEIEIYDI